MMSQMRRSVTGIGGWPAFALLGVTVVRITSLLLVLAFASQRASLADGKSPIVATKLAEMIERVVTATGISINIAESDTTSVNIDKVNGRGVCSKRAEKDVRVLQAAFDAQPDIYQNYSIYMIRITNPDGSRVTGDFAALRAKGVFKGDCINLYISVRSS
jgi:hypothetical protein